MINQSDITWDEPQTRPIIDPSLVSWDEPAPIKPGGSYSTLTNEPISEQEMLKNTSTESFGRPLLEVGGTVSGAAMAAPGGPGSAIAGGALGYAGGKNVADLLYQKEIPKTIGEGLYKTAKDVATGATMEMLGPVITKTTGAIVKPLAKVVKETLGTTTGAGSGMIDEAIKGGRSFKSAMRGKRTGQDVVDTAFDALQKIKDKRAFDYQTRLASIKKTQEVIDIRPIKKELLKQMKQFNIKFSDDGTIDYARVAMGKKGRADIEDVVQIVSEWGSKEGDNTPLGLDVLKRQLDDFYSDSSQARGFVLSLKKSVSNTISKSVPEYGKMTSKYSEATKIIKDIESNLMMRKQGISGRITPDQTLRRLTSSMRENFELRKELIEVLGKKAGEDVVGEVAGYTASQALPRGLIGKLSAGSIGVLSTIDPKFLGLLAASSPRAVGEFLNVFGMGLRQSQKFGPAVVKSISYKIGKGVEGNYEALNKYTKEQISEIKQSFPSAKKEKDGFYYVNIDGVKNRVEF